MTVLAHVLRRRPLDAVAGGALLPLAGAGLLLAVVEACRGIGVISPDYFPSIFDVAHALGEELGSVEFWGWVGNTLQQWAVGLGIAAAAAIPLGVIVGTSRPVFRSTRMLVELLRPVPPVAIIPLAVLIYGSGAKVAIFLALLGAFWPLFIQTVYGVRAVDTVLLATTRAYGLSRIQTFFLVTLPGASPYVATGLRLASAVSLILTITAGIVLGTPGLGMGIGLAQSSNVLPSMYALIIATGSLGVLLNTLVTRLERRLLHWHTAHREVTNGCGP